MFSIEDRDHLRSELISVAHDDSRIVAAALLGSSAGGNEDRWSDIDLALCVSEDADRVATIADWTDRMYKRHEARHHVDVFARGAVYRVFLLADTLQVDLSFWPGSGITPAGPRFRLLFGEAADAGPSVPEDVEELIGMAWLYALHGRSSIARDRPWQAEYMISAARDHVMALACRRLGLSAWEGRGVDDLPTDLRASLSDALVGSLDAAALIRGLAVTIETLLAEIEHAEPSLARRLRGPLGEVMTTAGATMR